MKGSGLTKVVAICGSVRMEKSNTVKILKPFLEGMEEAGASVELFYTKRLDVKPCEAELSCWTKPRGPCYIDDSMQSLYPKLRDADFLVLATPVYIPLPGDAEPTQQNDSSYGARSKMAEWSHAFQEWVHR
jgi:hypothetical protein